MKKNTSQSAVEWLMTHSWAIIVILLVGLTFAHLGFFDAQARPRFEGLNAAGIQPMPSEVQLYSDGVLVLTVRNTRPYTMRYDWVDISPIGDPSDTIRTYLGNLLRQGDVGSYLINGSNLAGGAGANLLLLADTQGKTTYTDFHITQQETHLIPGRDPETKTINGKAWQITTYSTPHGSGGGVTTTTTVTAVDCSKHRTCPCSEPKGLGCQICYMGFWDNYAGCANPDEGNTCQQLLIPFGECNYFYLISCSSPGDCPLPCHTCTGGKCADGCSSGTCSWSWGDPSGGCTL